MKKLTNKDIERIIKQWKKGKPIHEIANYFGITRQWAYKLIKDYKNSGTYPVLRKPGRKPKEVTEETRIFILKNYYGYRP